MTKFWKTGEPYVLFTGASLAVILVMTLTLIGVVFFNGLGFFWPRDLVRFELKDGSVLLGQVMAKDRNPVNGAHRLQLKVSNRDLYGQDFRWIDQQDIVARSVPADAVLLERREHGNFVGFVAGLSAEGMNAGSDKDLPRAVEKALAQVKEKLAAEEGLRSRMNSLNERAERLRLKVLRLEYKGREQQAGEIAELTGEREKLLAEFNTQNDQLGARHADTARNTVQMKDAAGAVKEIPLVDIVRFQFPNSMSVIGKAAAYVGKVRELLLDDPRESNTEGGLFPAIFGTVMMVLLMSVFSLPFGVVAAIYLREYAHDGFMTRMVRIAVNNLAGVPSIVYGVFGLGFFVYGVGGGIDRLFFPERLPTPTFGTGGILWSSLTLALLTVPVVIVATEESLASIPRGIREGSLALGATRFQTLTKILLPMATPGIMTGLILAMARAAGEVAPLMVVGVVKLAPSLPFDGNFPFFHMDRKFMHLGFHIYDVGFQSPNVEAAKPMVYITTLLLLAIVIVACSTAITLRNRMRKKYTTASF
ncbi:phosphate ABC transporter permease PstA [Geobacter sp. SVR]|uniref:phosphate ABC transporter permease PstA n=1 Tax=Geobacter sp. SVR TaxID=2495594 RepID=UPI00143EFB64|nr:phosphate ABC transporter permease PstA [Geobacter sp. SVR]BCS55924.1 phosphate transport system permease protein PstA [Geobacter sp. SVR]GCF84687.1 phosphate transport system permease protein PstA [Geobacter sp. SVR]